MRPPSSKKSKVGRCDVCGVFLGLLSELLFPQKSKKNKSTGISFAQVEAAVEANSSTHLKQLIERDDETVFLRHPNGMTALHFACSFGSVERSRMLLDAGAEVDAQDEDGWTPLHFAAQVGSRECVSLLLGRGARSQTVNRIKQTALHVAASQGNHDVVLALLDSANSDLINILDDNGANALFWAAYGGNPDIVKLLLERGGGSYFSFLFLALCVLIESSVRFWTSPTPAGSFCRSTRCWRQRSHGSCCWWPCQSDAHHA